MAEHPIQGLMGVTIEKIRDMVNAETIIGDRSMWMTPPSSRSPASPLVLHPAVPTSGQTQQADVRRRQRAGVSVTPVAFLVVSNGNVRTVQLVEKVSAVDNVIASLPELVDKVAALIKKRKAGC